MRGEDDRTTTNHLHICLRHSGCIAGWYWLSNHEVGLVMRFYNTSLFWWLALIGTPFFVWGMADGLKQADKRVVFEYKWQTPEELMK